MVDDTATLHATCVAVAGHGVLLTGPSRSGKSSLALQLMALGADLVSDDRTIIWREGDQLIAAPPPAITGMIEARGIGILSAAHLERAPVVLTVNLELVEDARLPERRSVRFLDVEIRCLYKVDAPYFPAAIHAYLAHIQRET